MAKASALTEIYQIKITLRDSKPPIWRRLELSPSHNLAELHQMIQVSMGWENAHLHQFNVNGQYYTAQEMLLGDDSNSLPAEKISVKKAFDGEQSKITYEYDFGDSWKHTLLLEKILQPEPDVQYPRCTAGKMACPPEDCGGLYGYYSMLEIQKNPEHPEYEDTMKWADGNIDPTEFSAEEVTDFFGQMFK